MREWSIVATTTKSKHLNRFWKGRREVVFLFKGHFANVCFWYKADIQAAPEFVAYWTNSGQTLARSLNH